MSTTFTMSANDIIVAALRKCGAIEPADTAATIDANILANTRLNLNLLIKQMMTKGIKLWTVTEYTVPYTVSKTSYTIGPTGPDLVADKPLKLIQAWLNNTSVSPNIRTPLELLSKQQYNLLGSPGSLGVTSSVFMDIRNTTSIVYVWNTPDTNTTANYQLHLVVQRPLNDINTGSDTPDFPIEWFNPLVWLLADDIAIEYEMPLNHRQEIMTKAAQYRDDLEAWDVESTSTFFQVDMRMRMERQ